MFSSADPRSRRLGGRFLRSDQSERDHDRESDHCQADTDQGGGGRHGAPPVSPGAAVGPVSIVARPPLPRLAASRCRREGGDHPFVGLESRLDDS